MNAYEETRRMVFLHGLAGRLRSSRAAAGMTQVELAARLSTNQVSVSRWERTEAAPDAYQLSRLAEELDVSVNDLMEEK